METQNHILHTIAEVYEKAKGSKLQNELFNTLEPQLQSLSTYFNCTPVEAFFLAIIFSLNFEERYIDIGTFKDFFDSSSHKVLLYNHVLESLRKKKLVKMMRERGSNRNLNRNDYLINPDVADSIVKGRSAPKLEQTEIENPIQLLEAVFRFEQMLTDDEIDKYELKLQFNQLLEEHKTMALVQRIGHLKLEDEEKYFFLYLAWETAVVGRNAINALNLLDNWFENQSIKYIYMQSFIKEENALIKHDLVELEHDVFTDDMEIKVSENGKAFLEQSGVNLIVKPKTNKSIIQHEKITQKKLFYNSQEKDTIALINQSLKPAKLKQIQQKMTEKGLSKGIVILLHGEPGTGKTETVYQLAKSTQRAIYHVDISNSKSMWYGESEKRIKRIFTDYARIAEAEKQFPILLFNEADAILSRRTDVEMSNVSRTENTIQNILLEQLEKFEGILVATTNLTQNIDQAFERRFLFKVRLHKPTTEARAHIWKMKFPSLKKSHCHELAQQFHFSGGQIDNILKKATMEEVIQGKKPNAKQLEQYCREETMEETVVRKVGFG